MPESVPPHWYNEPYHVPLHEPQPSKADYSPKNVAWLIEMFANILGKSREEIQLRYPNNTEYPETADIPEDDIIVSHPGGDRNYWAEEVLARKTKSPELMHYESHAKRSAILKLYEKHSPAGIEYFQ